MTTQTIERVVNEIKNLPDEKAENLIKYVHFLEWEEDDYFSEDEINDIIESREELLQGKGHNWREVKKNV